MPRLPFQLKLHGSGVGQSLAGDTHVSARYGGDGTHQGSAGATTFYVLGSGAGGLGLDLGTQPTLDPTATSPFIADCLSSQPSGKARGAATVSTRCLADLLAAISAKDNKALADPCMAALNSPSDVGSCAAPIRDAYAARVQQIDAATISLQEKIKERNRMFDQLRMIIDQYDKTTRSIITGIGQARDATASRRAGPLTLGITHVVVRAGHETTVRIKLGSGARKVLAFPRKLRVLLPALVFPIKVRLTLVVVSSQRGGKGTHPRGSRKTFWRLVVFLVSK
jgi:hypothetical protein